MNPLKRFKDEMVSLGNDLAIEMWTCRSKSKLNVAAAVGCGIGMIMQLGTMAYADGIEELGDSAFGIVSSLYNASFKVVTVFAALMLIIAFCVRMSGNPQKAAAATEWAKRVAICYVFINCIGLFFTVINDTAKSHGWTWTPSKTST